MPQINTKTLRHPLDGLPVSSVNDPLNDGTHEPGSPLRIYIDSKVGKRFAIAYKGSAIAKILDKDSGFRGKPLIAFDAAEWWIPGYIEKEES